MPASTDILTARMEAPALVLTLRHASPFWELTLQNTGVTSVWVDNRHFLPSGGGFLTISRRTRKPSFRLQISTRPAAWYTASEITAFTLRIIPPTETTDMPTVTVSEAYTTAVITTVSFTRPAPAVVVPEVAPEAIPEVVSVAEPEVAPDPHFYAPTFFPHVLQQLYFRDRALLTDILLRTQSFTPGQIAAFIAAVAEI